MTEHLPSKLQALNSNPSTAPSAKKKKKKKKKRNIHQSVPNLSKFKKNIVSKV
jgi:hypothetical protein